MPRPPRPLSIAPSISLRMTSSSTCQRGEASALTVSFRVRGACSPNVAVFTEKKGRVHVPLRNPNMAYCTRRLCRDTGNNSPVGVPCTLSHLGKYVPCHTINDVSCFYVPVLNKRSCLDVPGVANEPIWTPTTLGPFGNPSKWGIYGGRLHIFRR